MASITVEDYELRENEEGGSKTIKKTLKQLTSWTKGLVWCTNKKIIELCVSTNLKIILNLTSLHNIQIKIEV